MLISILSCESKQTKEKTVDKIETETIEVPEQKEGDKIETQAIEVPEQKKVDKIIGERIDGTAYILSKPNGDTLFELYDNALVEVSSKHENGWYQVLVYADIDSNEFGMDTILKDRPIIVDGDTIGKVLKSHYVKTGGGRNSTYAMLEGYIHKNNIKPETVIETAFKKNLAEKGRNITAWYGFIQTFDLDYNAVDYSDFKSFYNYENTIEDPSPGFRIVLLFEKQKLVGLIHSREIQIDNTTVHKLDGSYYIITFFNDYPIKKQMKFVDYMNEWVQKVD